LGELDEAFAWLEKAYQERDPELTYIKVPNRRFEPLRHDARFQQFVHRIGLPKQNASRAVLINDVRAPGPLVLGSPSDAVALRHNGALQAPEAVRSILATGQGPGIQPIIGMAESSQSFHFISEIFGHPSTASTALTIRSP
jgi:hypothetical protein